MSTSLLLYFAKQWVLYDDPMFWLDGARPPKIKSMSLAKSLFDQLRINEIEESVLNVEGYPNYKQLTRGAR